MEQVMTWWQVLIAISGALGGLEFVKWLFNRKTNSRIAIAEAESAEFHHLQETNEWLQKQLQAKEERFAEQTQIVRNLNREVLELTMRMAQMEVEFAKEKGELELEHALKKCEDIDCPFRRPPNAQTPPKPGLTKEEYHTQKLLTK